MTDTEVEEAIIANRWHILRYARGLTRDLDEANDITQETLETAWKYRHKYDPTRSAFPTWLVTIYHNVVRRRFREHNEITKEVSFISIDDLVINHTEEDAPALIDLPVYDDRLMLAQALKTLGGIHEDVIRMCFFEGYTFNEVAEANGITKRMVKRIVSTGLKRLRYILNKLT